MLVFVYDGLFSVVLLNRCAMWPWFDVAVVRGEACKDEFPAAVQGNENHLRKR